MAKLCHIKGRKQKDTEKKSGEWSNKIIYTKGQDSSSSLHSTPLFSQTELCDII